MKPHQPGDVIDVVGLGAHGFDKEARGLNDELLVECLQFGPFGFAMRVSKLRALRQPRGSERRQPADGRACQGGECRDVSRVHEDSYPKQNAWAAPTAAARSAPALAPS